MTKIIRKAIVAVVLCGLLLGFYRPAAACGPFFSTPVFSYTKHPDSYAEFAQGQLGVLRPRYARSYLFVAYRYLNGGSFTPEEQRGLQALWTERNGFGFETGDDKALENWLAARKKIAGGEDPKVDIYRAIGAEAYDTFVNCNASAFANATQTLNERVSKYGANNAVIKDWIAAQDRVFGNCAEGQNLPAEVAPNAPAWLKADRAYQIAAAKFYAKDFAGARAGFVGIAGDTNSPWRATAAYLIARTWLRQASFTEKEDERKGFLANAEEQLKKVQTDRAFASYQAPAERLQSIVKYRRDPAGRLSELARKLLQIDANLKQDLWDYTLLLDKYLKETDDGEVVLANVGPEARRDDLSEWVFAFQATDAADFALQKWQQTNSPAWLLAAISKVAGKNAQAAALIRAADALSPNAPAHATAQYHAARLTIEQGDNSAARARLDRIWQNQNALPVSARNGFLGLRMQAAATLNDFLQAAQRQPAAYSINDDGREQPDEPQEAAERERQKQARFDVDGAQAFNLAFPVSLLQQAANSPTLSEPLRREVALAAWTKAALLDDPAAVALSPVLAQLQPAMKGLLDEYATAPTPEARKSVALYLWLKFPVASPYARAGAARETAPGEIDSYRDNWWCASSLGYNPDAETKVEPPLAPALAFLTVPQKAAAKRENERLQSFGTAPNYFCQQAIAWAARAPADPRVPEALHLAVARATRYGCTDAATGKNSKAAYDLLKKRYPKSEWAQKTKFWYNG